MKVAIVHYHFRRGGVTSVVRNAVTALQHKAHTVVLSGELDLPKNHGARHPEIPGAWHRVEGLDYRQDYAPEAASALVEALKATATKALGGAPDVWHIHNSTLGKNPVLTAAASLLAAEGAALLLQLHDFAEDGRSENLQNLKTAFPREGTFASTVYPASPRIHYALLNTRDHSILRAAGLDESTGHVLPNPVPIMDLSLTKACAQEAIAKPYFLYPTRAIRRKNIGEILLLAALSKQAGAQYHFALTLAPDNSRWIGIYKGWVDFAKQHELPVVFEVGTVPGTDFESLVKGAEALITTSIAEGFGLAFLEAYSMGKDCVGRNLPDITADFTERGVNLNHLYTALPVAHPETGECVDFGYLTEELQREVIVKALLNPKVVLIKSPLSLLQPLPQRIEANRNTVAKHYSLAAYGDKLTAIYSALMAASPEQPKHLDALKIRGAFANLQRSPLLQ